ASWRYPGCAATRFASSMSVGNASVVTVGCGCTKSGGLETRVSVVVATVGTFGTVVVVSVAGATVGGGGAFLLLHAGARETRIKTSPTRNALTTLFMFWIITPAYSAFFDQSGSLFSPSNVSCVRSVPSVRIR